MSLSVNGQVIDDFLIREEVKQIKAALVEDLAGQDALMQEIRIRDWARENVVQRVLLEQSALSDPAPLPVELVENAVNPGSSSLSRLPGFGDERLKNVEVRLRIERLVNRIQASVTRPSRTELTNYYRRHQRMFQTPELVRAAHIVKNVDERTDEETAFAEIDKAYAALRTGRAFEEVADLYSDCPGRGGDLGYHPRGELVDEFEAVVFAMQPGQISEIFRTPFGFHIAKVYDRKSAGIRSLTEVKSEIEAMIINEKKQRALQAYVAQLRAKADIRTFRPAEELPPTR